MGIAFDGANIWVTNSSDNNVMKLDLDGNLLKTITVGTYPVGIACDDANIWVANSTSGNVMKLDPNTGSVLGTCTVGSRSCGHCL